MRTINIIYMKNLNLFSLLVLLACPLAILSCKSNGASTEAADQTAKDSLITLTANGVSFNMVLVKGGTFTMGATPEQGEDAQDNEKPAHEVTLSDYFIGETEVTQALYEAVMESNPSDNVGADLPVEMIDEGDCELFAQRLSELTGRKFRLPTEAEWEYAARGGNKSKGFKYAGSDNVEDVAWCGDTESGTHPVKGKAPNELGIYDMSGNVDEYCSDEYAPYSEESQTSPKAEVEESPGLVTRGGNFCDDSAPDCRVSKRGYSAGYVFGSLGFRVVMTIDK